MTFSQELPKGVENFLLNVSVENLLRAQDLIPLLSPLESEKHETSVEYDLNRWLENDAKYNVVDDSYRNGFGERPRMGIFKFFGFFLGIPCFVLQGKGGQIIIVRGVVQSLEQKHEKMLREVHRRQSTLRSKHKKRHEYLRVLLEDSDDAQSCLLLSLRSLVRRLGFARERLILTRPRREIHLPADVWSNILENFAPNLQTINFNNGKLNLMLKRWMISKVLFQTTVSLYYREAVFSFTPHSFMNCTTVKIMKKITIDISLHQWQRRTIGTESTCHLPKTTKPIEAYTLQKRLKECTALVELRFIIPRCTKIKDRAAGDCVSLSKADLRDLQRWKGSCDCYSSRERSNLRSSATLIPVEIF
ncbi:hypothetical protein sscle_11g081280 [Sclerotinia sclerotiorum 1980 UF-70]|uniref:Uncharacterized protein n=1 Tax=Sclerotinia sclerotiorum (strain ATCC 18683 / 1980 / Ss-1) TaxID=665079 RepID=A0A1D9QEN6_SCLS1|nr:hypothetical protein sscle_11g081280 [Sclerotinia sclerotiorum 1980 UF-70]